MKSERWKPVPGFVGRYEVSDQGRLRSSIPYRGESGIRLRRLVRNGGGRVSCWLSPGDGEPPQMHTIHSIVLLAFIGPRPDGMDIRHLDGDPTNNRLANLKYGTKSENSFDAVRHGTHNNARKTHCIRGHEFNEDNSVTTAQGWRRCLACRRIRERNAA